MDAPIVDASKDPLTQEQQLAPGARSPGGNDVSFNFNFNFGACLFMHL